MSQDKFKNTYRIASARLASWNYAWEGMYFITICTQGRKHYFGSISDGKMNLSAIGAVVRLEWLKTTDMRPDMNLDLSCYIIMPNHFHAIVGIGRNQYNVGTETGRDAMHCVSTENQNRFGPQSKNLASIVRGFKIGVTRHARQYDTSFAWQSRFHDHIIRDYDEFIRILLYIENNPLNWASDRFYKNNEG